MSQTVPAMLFVEKGEYTRRFLPLYRPLTTIGREEANDVVIIHHLVSRLHAQIRYEGTTFIIEDLKSTNGTKVNGKILSTPHHLEHGDLIEVGATQYIFNLLETDGERLSEFLHKIQLFSSLDIDDLNEVGAKVQIKQVPSGTHLFAQELEDNLYIVIFGELVARQNAQDGEGDLEYNRYLPGQFFDGIRLLENTNADYLEAVETAWLLILKRENLNVLIVPFLRRMPFLGDLSQEQLQAVTRHLFIDYYSSGKMLFQQDDYADALYIVVFGKVTMIKRSDENEQVIWDEIRSYDGASLFGELGLLADQPRAASGEVREDTGLLILPRTRFQALVAQYPEILLSLYRYLSTLLEGQSIAFWRAARDIKKMQDLIQSAKMAALGQLVAGIAHEINTPVGSISSNSYSLRNVLFETKKYIDSLPDIIERFNENDALMAETAVEISYVPDANARAFAKRHIEKLQQHIQACNINIDLEEKFQDLADISEELSEASRRIKDMVLSLANFTRLDEAERKMVDIHEGIDSTLSLLHHELKYKVVVEKNYGNLPDITCSPNALNQVFMNIILNAIQAMELDKLDTSQKGLLQISTYREGKWGVIAITDSGKGISSKDLPKIFDPFFSTRGAAAAAGGLGLGLGLSISQQIIEERHAGEIRAESKSGKGTTFFIKLPLDKATPSTATLTIDAPQKLRNEVGKMTFPNPEKMIQIFTTKFDVEELRLICFELGYDYDNLPGETVKDKVSEFVLNVDRRNRLPELYYLSLDIER